MVTSYVKLAGCVQNDTDVKSTQSGLNQHYLAPGYVLKFLKSPFTIIT